MVKRLTTLVLALWAFAGSALAQDPESAFAGIFRGKLPGTYPYKYNGTYYWDRPEFQQGDVFYNGRLYRDISLNIDACEGELQVRPMEKVSAVVVFTDQVAWFTMGGKRFVNLRYLGWKDAPEGFFEVVRDGETPLLLRWRNPCISTRPAADTARSGMSILTSVHRFRTSLCARKPSTRWRRDRS